MLKLPAYANVGRTHNPDCSKGIFTEVPLPCPINPRLSVSFPLATFPYQHI